MNASKLTSLLAPKELQQLVTNLICILDLRIDIENATAVCEAVDIQGKPLDLPAFQEWFRAHFTAGHAL